MKRILKFIFIISLSFIILPSVIFATEASEEAYMIITNPGEHVSTQMNISWHMDEGVTDGKLIYTTKDDEDWDNAITVEGDYELIDVFKNRRDLKYSVNLSNLQSDTEYKYKVGSTSFSETRYFKTAGGDKFSFVWTGDGHRYTQLPQRTQ